MVKVKVPLIEFWDIEEDRYGKTFDRKRISLDDILPHITQFEIKMIEYELLIYKDKIIKEINKLEPNKK